MKKYVLCFLILSALLFPVALRAGEEGAIPLERLRAEAEDPGSNVIRVTDEGGDALLYLDKRAFNETPSRQVVLGSEALQMEN